MIFQTSPSIPQEASEIIHRVGSILLGSELHENHLHIMCDEFQSSNVDGPTLSFLIKRRILYIEVKASWFFFVNRARVSDGRILINMSTIGGLDIDELTYLIGANTALILINESSFWISPRALVNDRGNPNPASVLGNLCSDLYRRTYLNKGVTHGQNTSEKNTYHVID